MFLFLNIINIITAIKVVSRKQNMSVFGSSLPSIFSSSVDAPWCQNQSNHDFDLLDLDGLSEYSTSACTGIIIIIIIIFSFLL